MRVGPTYYNDAGELMAPRPGDVNISNTLGGFPTLDPGFYHVFEFLGRTQSELEGKYARFTREMRTVPGFMQLTVYEYKGDIGNFVRYGVRILYAIETADGIALMSDYDWVRLKDAHTELAAFIQKVQRERAANAAAGRSATNKPSTRSASSKSSAPTMVDIMFGKR